VDISRGPMVGNTGFVGRATVTAAHKLNSSIKNLYRFQGVALPKGFTVIIKINLNDDEEHCLVTTTKESLTFYFIFPDKPFCLWNS